MHKKTVDVRGMHCKACEMLIEDEVKKIDGVKKVSASNVKGQVEIYSKKEINDAEIDQAVKNAGYQVGINETGFFSKNISDYVYTLIFLVVISGISFLISQAGFFNNSISNTNNGSLLFVLLMGLTAGVSTCMALVGGLVLSLSAKYVQTNTHLSTYEKFQPQIYFNLGRIIGFFVLGGIIGYFGSIFQLSNNLVGVLTVIVSLVMFLLGLQLIGIFPALSRINFTLPKFLSRRLNLNNENSYSDQSAFILGTLTFFLPCGFTQAMQLYAISTGSWERGAMIMAVFALGTTPGLLGIGGLTTIIKGNLAKIFFMFAGTVIILMAVFNFKNGLNLTDLHLTQTPSKTENNLETKNGFQIIRMTQDNSGYTPNSFNLKKGVPVKWIITSQAPNSCAASIFVPKLGIKKYLQPGENVIEFTPNETGEIKFTCSMGMYSGYLIIK